MRSEERGEQQPLTRFLSAWGTFLRLEFLALVRLDCSRRAERLKRIRLSFNQAMNFYLGFIGALIGLPMVAGIMGHAWFYRHDIIMGFRGGGNWQGALVGLGLYFVSYLVITCIFSVIWLFIRQPLDSPQD